MFTVNIRLIIALGFIGLLAVLASATTTFAQENDLPDGLVSWWTGDGSGNDEVGENHGTLTGGTTFDTGKFGQAFRLDGNGEIVVNNSSDLNVQNLTIEAWVFPTVIDGWIDIIVNKEGAGQNPIQYELGIRGTAVPGTGTIPVGNFAFFLGGISGLPDQFLTWVDGGGPIPLNSWTHVALTFDGRIAKTYINGSPSNEFSNLVGTLPLSSGSLRIGSRTSPVNDLAGFNGIIDEVRLFNRALTDSEVKAMYSRVGGIPDTIDPTPVPIEPTPVPIGSTSDIRVVSAQLSPNSPVVGDVITVNTTVVNFSDDTNTANLEVEANNVVVSSQTVTLQPQENKQVRFSFTADQAGPMSVEVGGIEQLISVEDGSGAEQGVMRVGPTVRLAANKNVVTKDDDAIIDLFWDNSSLNEATVMIEVTVDVPSGLYLYSQQGGMACAAGTCKGLFTAPPGSVRNLPMIIKADQVGGYFIHLLGRYWPEGNPDQWNPISLITPITVTEASPDPEDSAPTSPEQVAAVEQQTGPAGNIDANDDGNTFVLFTNEGLIALAIGAVVIVLLGSYWALRSDIKIGPFGGN